MQFNINFEPQLTSDERAAFDHLLLALKSGAPPHGGIAIGIYLIPVLTSNAINISNVGFDRLMAILCNSRTIREVIAFPKTASGMDLLFRSPSPLNKEELIKYGLESQ